MILLTTLDEGFEEAALALSVDLVDLGLSIFASAGGFLELDLVFLFGSILLVQGKLPSSSSRFVLLLDLDLAESE